MIRRFYKMRRNKILTAGLLLVILSFSTFCDHKDKGNGDPKHIVIDETADAEWIVKAVKIDSVWSGHPVGFCLMTCENRQYVAYYNSDRHMVVGQRDLGDSNFLLFELTPTYRETSGGTSTVLGWDSHNYITMAVDNDGFIHMAGNMHVNPITYFRSTKPWDIFTVEQVMEMTGQNEKKCTYPNFMKDREGNLIFHYRDGSSGNGNEIYNIYSCEQKKWSRMLDTPLTDGQGLMNAYQSEPALMGDNWFHVFWVWRDTPDCSTNHDLSYMKSPDLIHWFNAFEEPVILPATYENKSLIVDPIPVKGGIINLAARLCLDEDYKPLFAYHKYDSAGNLQLYIARIIDKRWVSKQVTNWDYRWEFSGGGSIVSEVRIGDFIKRNDGFFELSYGHIKYGSGTILLDKNLDTCGIVIKPKPFTSKLKLESTFPGIAMKTSADIGVNLEKNTRYVLKWETLPSNRDKARPEPWPAPSTLYLYKLAKGK